MAANAKSAAGGRSNDSSGVEDSIPLTVLNRPSTPPGSAGLSSFCRVWRTTRPDLAGRSVRRRAGAAGPASGAAAVRPGDGDRVHGVRTAPGT
jgi:hypothetical protein